jgi:beta-glucosidase
MTGSDVLVNIENTGHMAGAEVVMLYISFDALKSGKKSRFLRPVRTLAGFQKFFLEPGEEASVVMTLDRYSTAVWDEIAGSWLCEAGTYIASVMSSSGSLEASFVVERDIDWNGA